MKLEFIDIGNIDDSAVNMRHGKKAPDVSDILPTVRKRGIIVPVILRPGAAEGRFDVLVTVDQSPGSLAPSPYPSLRISRHSACRSGASSSAMRGWLTSATMIWPTSWLTSPKMPCDFIFDVW